MAKKKNINKIDKICPHCKFLVKVGIKVWGEPSPKCPNCGEQILDWLENKDEYHTDFRVAGGTGAQKGGIKKFGGRKPL